MPTTSLRAACCSEDWKDHERYKDRAWALVVQNVNPQRHRKASKAQAQQIARQIESEKKALAKKHPDKCGFWAFLFPVLVNFIISMIQAAITHWFRPDPVASVAEEWTAEQKATKKVALKVD